MAWKDHFITLSQRLAAHEPSLYPAEELDELDDIRIGKLSVEGFGEEEKPFALAVKSALHLFNESLDASHELSQELHTPEGSLLHGIMHRMEGDYPNAQYWLRLAGRLPFSDELGGRMQAYLREQDLARVGSPALREKLEAMASQAVYDPASLTEAVEQQVTRSRDEGAEVMLKHLQWMELRQLLDYCYVRSGGEGGFFA
ncbi:hypothetical protein [Paenibacillus mucilaginosus]|uniref:Uncharacterized protein n=1 Tax=Paenibacillus mucilaginosus (strain KNP414) TaxID=1036673 RepID=F8FNP5_PAEMK|nr:hypothetical protein [Paenibacillus mucilaginosus]AEI40157.1 hypothetical protein KNP414_01593 [Paenibacillus mucilaginosus KNP414]MCG7215759.1 hypothetical protein [Paenibacillus mucilaginosus]WDM29389.1 hypothetical protein KCX80_09605 [Paenibacillus mucilaginosus]